MSSALKPVLSQGGPQNPAPQMSKNLHGQGPATYGQPSAHMPQNLVSIQHGLPTPAHNSGNIQNHYLNVPNTPYNTNMSIPASNHPIPNMNQPSAYSNPPKNQFPSNFQPNLTSQPAPVPQQASVPPEPQEKPHSNGTPDVQNNQANEQNHTTIQKEVLVGEKAKQDKPATPVSSLTDESSNETKQREENAPDVIDSSSSASIEGMEITTSNSSTAENKTEEADVPSESANVTEGTGKGNTEEAKMENVQGPAAPIESANTQPKEQVTSKASTKPSAPRTLSKKLKPPKIETTESVKPSKPDKSLVMKSPSRAKRARTKTQPYQYPLPELEIISKMTSSPKPTKKDNDEKLIIFYKNEFLAVRNTEGGFYICQAVQNIYKGSSKIKIRWLSQDGEDKTGEVYTPDFYDLTDVDCILTNLELTRMDKAKFKLPAKEKSRTDSILKRALAVEKGETVPPSPTEEHPDGLDLSLYKEESQLQKPKGKKRKSSGAVLQKTRKSSPVKTKRSIDQPKVRKVAPSKPKSKMLNKKMITRKAPVVVVESKKASPALAASRSERAKRRQDNISTSEVKASPVIDAKKAKVLAKVVKKVAAKVAPPTKKQPIVKKEVKPAPAPKGTKLPVKKAKRDPTPTERKTKRTRK